MMFKKLRRARADVAMMNRLLPAAERIARDDGVGLPGAEHLLLAAIDLDDGIASGVLRASGIEPADLRSAIAGQHADALTSIGVVADDQAIAAALPPSGTPQGPYRSQGSLQVAFQESVALAQQDRRPLNSGYVLLAVTDAEHGTLARALDRLGADRTQLRQYTRRALGA